MKLNKKSVTELVEYIAPIIIKIDEYLRANTSMEFNRDLIVSALKPHFLELTNIEQKYGVYIYEIIGAVFLNLEREHEINGYLKVIQKIHEVLSDINSSS